MNDFINLFSTPIYEATLALDLEKLKSYCYKCQEQDTIGCQKSNRNGFHSKNLNLTDETLGPLQNQIVFHMNKYADILNATGMSEITSMWININPPNGSNVAHIHPGAFMSGVMFIQTNEHTGNLYFQNPNPVEFDWKSKFFKNTRLNTYCNDMWDFLPRENSLYLFPSWAKHGVHTNVSDFDRISISFNGQLK